MTYWLAAFARTLFGIRIEDDKVVELANLVEHTGRLRTIDGWSEGYVLIEHQDGGSLLRLVSAETAWPLWSLF